MALRVLLRLLGVLMTVASRWSDRFRRQLTRDVVVEISSDDGVARHFIFRNGRASSRSGRASRPDSVLRFATAQEGFRMLTGLRRLAEGLLDESVQITGTIALVGWFQGLVQSILPGATRRVLATPPKAYRAPRSSLAVSRFITREPSVAELDPEWTTAMAARAKLCMMRVAAGDPLPPL